MNATVKNQEAKENITTILKAEIAVKRAEVKRLVEERRVMHMASATERKLKAQATRVALMEKKARVVSAKEARELENALRADAIKAKKDLAFTRRTERSVKSEALAAARVIREESTKVRLTERLAKVEAQAKKIAAANAVKTASQHGLSKTKEQVRKPSAVTMIAITPAVTKPKAKTSGVKAKAKSKTTSVKAKAKSKTTSAKV